MSQYIEKYKKNIVIDMRKRGYSYSEIQNSIHVPKSTIAFWLKGTKLTPQQSEKLKNKQLETARANSEKRKTTTLQLIEEIKNSSAKDVKEISKKELWLMGVMLYWRERLLLNNQNDLRKGVNFTSSDPYLIKLFLKWLKDVGNINDQEIRLDLFVKKENLGQASDSVEKIKNLKNIISYWSDVTGFPKNDFKHIYFQKSNPDRNKSYKRKNKKVNFENIKQNQNKNRQFRRSQYGLLRIRVKASSMLARQIAGWMRGIQNIL